MHTSSSASAALHPPATHKGLLPGAPSGEQYRRGKVPGILVSLVIAAAAFSLHQIPGLGILSPAILAVVAGIVFANLVGVPAHAEAGIAFCQRGLLRFAIVLLGFQLTLSQAASIGVAGIAAIGLAVLATYMFTRLLGRLLGVDPRLTQLIAAGTSICGASAIVAANAVTRAGDEDVAYAVASITLFGTIAMFSYPVLAPVFGLDAPSYGMWVGASIHEVAQVVGAGFQNGQESGEIATVTKLSRVAMLAPLVLSIGLMARRGTASSDTAKPPVPWFVFAFVAVVCFNTFIPLPAEAKALLAVATTVMLAVGLAAMGLKTNVSDIRSRGLKPLFLALSAFLFIASASLLLVKLAG